MAAAKGMLPLASDEMLQALVVLSSDQDPDIRASVSSTLDTLDPVRFTGLASDEGTSPEVLGFLVVWTQAPFEMLEAAIFNRSTPDEALAHLAGRAKDSAIVEAISLKQQSLIRSPAIIEAIMANPARTPDAERRAREVQQEFFEKQFGAKLVAEEERARKDATTAAGEGSTISVESLEDLINLGLIEPGIDDSLVQEYEAEFGPFEHTGFDLQPAQIEDILEEIEQDESAPIKLSRERLPVFQQIAIMSVKDRVMLAIKGTREARMILVRDPNRIVASAVLRNPRLTDAEVESISAMRTAPEEVLRQIGHSRAWIKSYTVIHNLIRNPRTPIAISLGMMNRIQSRDLRILSTNKNIPDVIRTTAGRLFLKRTQGAG